MASPTERSLARRVLEPGLICPHHHTGPGWFWTDGPAVGEIAAAAGFAPDPQQQLALDVTFAVDRNGAPASFAVCVVCARQNLKTGFLKQTALGWLYVLDVPEVVWSAHELPTAKEAQRELLALLKAAPSLSRRMMTQKNEGSYDANGEERIELATGQTIWFKARTATGARGLARPKLILDEAFALKASMLGSVLPLMTAQHHPQVVYASSPGTKTAASLRELRDRGRAGTSPELTYLEWGGFDLPDCPPDCAHPKTGLAYGDPCVLNRLELIEEANPTLVNTERITVRTMANLRQEMPADEWLREFMGRWEDPDDGAAAVFGAGFWESGETDAAFPTAPAALGVAVSVDRTSASIAAAGFVEVLEDETAPESEPVDRVLVAPVERRDGTGWLIPRLKELQDRYDCPIIIDGKGPTADLIEAMEAADLDFLVLNLEQYALACSRFFVMVRELLLLHRASTELDEAVAGAVWRLVGDGRQVWGRRKSTTEGSMLEAATLAVHGAEQAGAGFNIY